jgi:hypothetical protein
MQGSGGGEVVMYCGSALHIPQVQRAGYTEQQFSERSPGRDNGADSWSFTLLSTYWT